MQQERQELSIITKAKDLCRYILTVTEKSPKRFRFTLVSRMQNLALDVVEQAYRANEIYPSGTKAGAAWEKRMNLQQNALVNVKLLGYLALVAREQGAILPKQYEQITRQVYDCQRLLGAWMKSDRRRQQK